MNERRTHMVLLDGDTVVGLLVSPVPLHQGEWTHLLTVAERETYREQQRINDAWVPEKGTIQIVHIVDTLLYARPEIALVPFAEYAL